MNGVVQASGVAVSQVPTNLAHNVTVAFGQTTGYTVGDTFSAYYGNTADPAFGLNDFYTVSRLQITGTPPNLITGQFVQIQGPTPIATPFVYNGVSFSWGVVAQNTPYGHAVGDSWTIELTPRVFNAWADVFSDINARKPGQGAVLDREIF